MYHILFDDANKCFSRITAQNINQILHRMYFFLHLSHNLYYILKPKKQLSDPPRLFLSFISLPKSRLLFSLISRLLRCYLLLLFRCCRTLLQIHRERFLLLFRGFLCFLNCFGCLLSFSFLCFWGRRLFRTAFFMCAVTAQDRHAKNTDFPLQILFSDQDWHTKHNT